MKKNIFIHEFIGAKSKLYRLTFIMTFVFVLISLSTTFIIVNNNMNHSADIELYGTDVSRTLTYNMYQDIQPVYEFFTNEEYLDYFDVYPAIYRFCFSNYVSPLTNVQFDIYAYGDDYLNHYLKDNVISGRLPENNSEVVVGAHFQKYFDLKVGDTIGDKFLTLNSPGAIMFNISLDESKEIFDAFKITGVIADEKLNFSIVRRFDESFIPNQLLIYYKNSTSDIKYHEAIQAAKELGLNKLIGHEINNYSVKMNHDLRQIMSYSMIAFLFLIMLLLCIMYIMKGTNKKIGILKALGIEDRVIISILANGFLKLLVKSLIFAVVISNIIYFLLNLTVNNYYGFAINTYGYSWTSFVIQTSFSLLSYLAILIMIKYRTLWIKPKECITKL